MATAPKVLPIPPTAQQPEMRRSLRAWLWPESGAVSPIPALDGLRALAVLLVILFHAWTFVPGYLQKGQNPSQYAIFYGKTGVQLFFVLSGFLLSLPYAQWAFGLRSRPETLMFYKRRALRVGPAYWVSLVILILTGPLTLSALKDLALHIVFLSNTTWETTFSINGVYWTMAIEVQFYALLPAIGWALKTLSQKIGVLRATAVLFSILVVISLLSYTLGNVSALNSIPLVSSALLTYSAMPYWLAVFGCGISCSILYTYLQKVAHLDRRQARRLPGIFTRLFLLGALFALALAFVPALHATFALDLWFGVAYTGLLVGVLFGAPILRKPFESRLMRFIGLTSYSFYIWHRVVLHVLAPHLHILHLSLPLQVFALFVIGTIASAAVAYCSYQFLERPFINARKHAHEATPTARPQSA